MPPSSDRPLQKVTMNFYRDDVAYFVAKYGSGWTAEIRRIIELHTIDMKAQARGYADEQ